MPKRYFTKSLTPGQADILEKHIQPEDFSTEVPLGESFSHEVAVLFFDLVNFTNISWSLDRDEVMPIVQPFFSHVCAETYRAAGMIDKYPGDGVVAFFPRYYGVDTECTIVDEAMDVATRVMCWFYKHHRPRFKLTKPSHSLELCVGLDAGVVNIAHVGCAYHSELILLGDQVNCASKCQAVAEAEEVVIGQDAVAMLHHRAFYEQYLSTGPQTGIVYTNDNRPYLSKRFDWKRYSEQHAWVRC